MLSIGILGVGRWGPNLVRNFSTMQNVSLDCVCDIDEKRIEEIKKRYPHIKVTSDAGRILEDTSIDCSIISTPLSTHFHLAERALHSGHHVFVEKPLAASSDQCRKLIDLAAHRNRILFVGHVFKYNASINAVKEYIQRGELGKIFVMDANRTNLGPVRYDTNALWDLASHDISIFSHWLGKRPLSVSAKGGCFLNKKVEDVVYATFEFEDSVIAHIHASWLNPRKIREITVVGEKKMLVWNDINLSEPLRIYNRGIDREDEYQDTFGDFRLSIREGEVIIPSIQLNQPLMEECHHFVECVEKGVTPITDGVDGLTVVLALEAAEKSLQMQSKTVTIDYDQI